MSFGITILTYRNNHLLFSTLKHLVERTDFIENTEVHILAQCCSKSYIKTLETICKAFDKPGIVKFILHTTEENLGVHQKIVAGKLKRQFAVAIDRDGVEVLQSDYSFTLDPNDLIEQLKLIIDQRNLQA